LLWFFSIKENCWFDRNNLVWWGGGNIRSIIKGSWWLLTNHLFVSFIVCHFCAAFWGGGYITNNKGSQSMNLISFRLVPATFALVARRPGAFIHLTLFLLSC
jgi:hypothetical protein